MGAQGDLRLDALIEHRATTLPVPERPLAELLRTRRSIRRFRGTPIPRELLGQVVESATWAPSSFNQQDWSLVAVQGERKDAIVRALARHAPSWADRIRELFSDAMAERMVRFFSTMGGAPVLVFVYAGVEEGASPLQGSPGYASACAAVQNLLLAAHGAGLGACWVQAFCAVEAEISRVLGVEGRVLVGGIPLGYPDEIPRVPPRKDGRVRWVGFEDG